MKSPVGRPGAPLEVRVRRPGEWRSASRSATRALDVLEYFGQMRRPLRAVQIARALDLHPSTANQLLKTMLESAHLTFDAVAKTYLPSPRLAAFGAWMVQSFGGEERLRALLNSLQAATGEVVTLTTANDLFMQIVDLAGPPASEEHRPPERGLRVSIFGSATGAAYLSMLPKAEVERLASRARLGADDVRALSPRIEEVRRDGVADGQSADGRLWSIAAPLPTPGASVRLVLGLAGPAERVHARLDTLRSAVAASAAAFTLR